MPILARRIEHTLDMTIERPQHSDAGDRQAPHSAAPLCQKHGTLKTKPMEYRGIEYQVVKVDGERGGHGGWKWSVRLGPYTSASGTEDNRVAAITAAEKKIDLALGAPSDGPTCP